LGQPISPNAKRQYDFSIWKNKLEQSIANIFLNYYQERKTERKIERKKEKKKLVRKRKINLRLELNIVLERKLHTNMPKFVSDSCQLQFILPLPRRRLIPTKHFRYKHKLKQAHKECYRRT